MTDEPGRGLRALDKAMLDACTRISHHVQRRTGLTNFFIARCLGVFAAGVGLLDLIADYAVPRTTEDYAGGPRVLNDAILLVYLGYALIIRPEHLEETFLVSPDLLPKQHLVDREPCRWRPILFSAAIFFPLLFSFMGRPVWLIVRSTGPFWCLLSLYFMAVMPLPPGQEHVKEDVFGSTAAMETPSTPCAQSTISNHEVVQTFRLRQQRPMRPPILVPVLAASA